MSRSSVIPYHYPFVKDRPTPIALGSRTTGDLSFAFLPRPPTHVLVSFYIGNVRDIQRTFVFNLRGGKFARIFNLDSELGVRSATRGVETHLPANSFECAALSSRRHWF
jgi:hypothetical protein